MSDFHIFSTEFRALEIIKEVYNVIPCIHTDKKCIRTMHKNISKITTCMKYAKEKTL